MVGLCNFTKTLPINGLYDVQKSSGKVSKVRMVSDHINLEICT